MTLSTERAKSAQAVEYLLAIEGVGWPSSDGDPASYYVAEARLFASADITGSLASCFTGPVLLSYGLSVESSIEESLDPRSLEHSVGGMTFKIVDAGGWLLANFSPHRTGQSTTLYETLPAASRTVKLSDGTNFATGDLVWLGGRELVKLGTKANIAGTAYQYTTSERGYLGTPIGRVDVFGRGGGDLQWEGGTGIGTTQVNTIRRFWRDARVQLLAHVPGEVDTFQAIWRGRIRNVRVPSGGDEWSIQCVGEKSLGLDILRKVPSVVIESNIVVTASSVERGSQFEAADLSVEYYNPVNPPSDPSSVGRFRRLVGLRSADQDRQGVSEHAGMTSIATSYQYRTEPGGTRGVLSGMTPPSTTIQAYDSTDDTDINYSLLSVGESVYRMLKRAGGWSYPFVIAELSADWLGQYDFGAFENGATARIMLDNWTNSPEISRFAVNNCIMRHPIDVALCFLTSMPGEYFRVDAAGGSTSSNVVIASSPITGLHDWSNGFALHCVEGVNKGQARRITNYNATNIGVTPPFDSAPGVGDEYQIRNSLYDVLPLGWGLGLVSTLIDVESFERVRDQSLPGARIGRFAIGAQDEIDIFSLVQTMLLKPYGVFCYVDHGTGKLTASYVGEAAQDGLEETYATLTEAEIVQVGEIDYALAKPIGRVNVNVRTTDSKTVRYNGSTWGRMASAIATGASGDIVRDVPSVDPTKGEIVAIPVDASNVEASLRRDGFDVLELDARMNTLDDAEHIVARAVGMMKRYAVPPPTINLFIDIAKQGALRLGQVVKVTDSRIHDPYTGARGVTSALMRIVRLSHPTMTGGNYISLQAQMLGNVTLAKLAPAAVITAATYDGGLAKWYLTVEDKNFVSNPMSTTGTTTEDKDWWYFAVGDAVRVYDRTGAAKGNARAIVYFGSNQSATPEGASDSRIYLDGDPGISYAAQDYVTFEKWGASTSGRQTDYSHWADAAGYIYSTTIPAKVYA